MRRLLCLLGRHRRSRGRTTVDGPRIESVCRNCGKPMHKDHGKWVVSTRDGAVPGDQPESRP